MEEPIIQLNNKKALNKLIKYLEMFEKHDIISAIQTYDNIRISYDTKNGELKLMLYDGSHLSCIYYICCGDQLERYKLWQYFYMPEHRDDYSY